MGFYGIEWDLMEYDNIFKIFDQYPTINISHELPFDYLAMENGPFDFADLPIENGDSPYVM